MSETEYQRTSERRRKKASAQEPTPKRVLDVSRYVPITVARLRNKLRISGDRFLSSTYGLSVREWRVLSFLAAEEPVSAYTIWTKAELDKAVVSRALRALKARDLVVGTSVPGDQRRKSLVELTAAGRDLEALILVDIIARHDRLTYGLSLKQIDAFLSTLSHLEGQVSAMSDHMAKKASGHRLLKVVPARRP